MQLISKFNKGICYLLCAVDIHNEYTWFLSLQDIKVIKITNAFQNVLNKSSRKPNKTWVDEGSKFYNRSKKPWLQDSDIEMCSIHNEGKTAVVERFISTLKNKIYKYITSV